jgi:hypothetical protein
MGSSAKFDSQFDSHGLGQGSTKGMLAEIGTRDLAKVWTRADGFPATLHVGNTGSNPVGDAQ